MAPAREPGETVRRVAISLRDRLQKSARGFTVWEASMLAGYVAIRLLSSYGKHPGVFGDTAGYLHFHGFGTPRPWTVPLLYGAFGRHHTGIVVAQVLIACAAWTFLAHTMATTLRRHRGTALQVLVVGIVLAIALSVRVAEWDYQLLSESLSISLLAVFVALVVRFAHAPTPRRAVAIAACGGLWMQTRDSNTIIFVAIVAMLGIVGLMPWRRGVARESRDGYRMLVGVGLLTMVASLALSAHTNDQRLLQPTPAGEKYARVTVANVRLMDDFGKRIFHDPKAIAFFVRHGMPASAATQFVDFAGADQDFKMYTDVEFVRWVDHHGMRTYELWLASNPWKTVRTPFQVGGDLFSPNIDYYFASIRHHLPPALEDVIWPAQSGRVVEVVLLALGAAAVAGFRRRRTLGLLTDGGQSVAIGVALCASAFVGLILTWQLEWLEAARHNVTNTIALRLAVVQLILAALVLAAASDQAPDTIPVDEPDLQSD